MDTWLYFSVKFVHVLAMAVYVGATVAAPIGMRRALALGPKHGHDFMVRLQETTKIIIASGRPSVLPLRGATALHRATQPPSI
jgi:hypothetical protein